jgi:hypothetical protein
MGRKEMGILRRAGLEGLRLAIALCAFRSPGVCEKILALQRGGAGSVPDLTVAKRDF